MENSLKFAYFLSAWMENSVRMVFSLFVADRKYPHVHVGWSQRHWSLFYQHCGICTQHASINWSGDLHLLQLDHSEEGDLHLLQLDHSEERRKDKRWKNLLHDKYK